MKKMTLKYVDVDVKVNNKREERFVRIINQQIDDVFRYWSTDEDWAIHFEEKMSFSHLFQELGAYAGALYFMGMIDEPLSSVAFYEAVEEAVRIHKRAEAYVEDGRRDIAKVCGIEEGSEEWYQLQSI